MDGSVNGYPLARTQDHYARALEEILRVPGVSTASMAEVAPLTGDRSQSTIYVEGYKAKEDENMNREHEPG
ncbi:MAG: hypothetical protein DMG57_30010 [Acidobacteria bacterium]|nr:MAG: hypothetical protein DMG57_30010 [Acidobacteriota bacterium]